MKTQVSGFWERICDLETEYQLYIVHGSKHGSIIINSDSEIVAYVTQNGELNELDDEQFKQANGGAVVTGKFEV